MSRRDVVLVLGWLKGYAIGLNFWYGTMGKETMKDPGGGTGKVVTRLSMERFASRVYKRNRGVGSSPEVRRSRTLHRCCCITMS